MSEIPIVLPAAARRGRFPATERDAWKRRQEESLEESHRQVVFTVSRRRRTCFWWSARRAPRTREQVYVCTIKALRHLDPSGVTLEAVSERVRGYLKARSDTVRQIVTSLTDPEYAGA